MNDSSTTGFSRRRLIQGAGVGAGAAVAVGAGFLGGRASADESGAPVRDILVEALWRVTAWGVGERVGKIAGRGRRPQR